MLIATQLCSDAAGDGAGILTAERLELLQLLTPAAKAEAAALNPALGALQSCHMLCEATSGPRSILGLKT